MNSSGEPRFQRSALTPALQTLLLSADGIGPFLQELADQSAAILGPPLSCGITTQHDGHPLTVAASDHRAAQLDESQYAANEGTCLEAMWSGEVIAVVDTATDSRWPTYLARAREFGLRSSLSLPLIVHEESIGAMNLYRHDRVHAFDGAERLRAEAFAARASTALLLALRQISQSETLSQFEAALTSRSVIDQALGILMSQQRCTATEAFELLRQHSQNANRKLRDIAAILVANTTGSPPDGGHPFEYAADRADSTIQEAAALAAPGAGRGWTWRSGRPPEPPGTEARNDS